MPLRVISITSHSHWLRNKNLGDVRSVPFRSYARFWISSMCWNMLPWGISDETLLEHWDKLSPAIQTHSDDTDMIAELYQMVNDAPATIRGMRLEKGCTYAWKSVI